MPYVRKSRRRKSHALSGYGIKRHVYACQSTLKFLRSGEVYHLHPPSSPQKIPAHQKELCFSPSERYRRMKYENRIHDLTIPFTPTPNKKVWCGGVPNPLERV